MDTEREYEIVLLEVQEENQLLIEQWERDLLGRRAQRMMQNAGSTEVPANAPNEQPPGIAGPEPELTY